MASFTLGCDPELFAVDSAGKHKALCGLIGGTKDNPVPFSYEMDKQFAYQEDNVAVEFNIAPAHDRFTWKESVLYAYNATQEKLAELGLSISKDCAVSFDAVELSHPQALVFGCEPDYDAWKLTENKKPMSANPNLRTAGGHIHVGCHNVDMVKGVQNMDLFLGVPSVLLDDLPESVIRRELYGKAGAMRPKPYGFEYRTLSNFWIFEEKFINWVWNATGKALDFKHTFTKKEEAIITSCINTGDKKAAADLIKHYKLVMP